MLRPIMLPAAGSFLYDCNFELRYHDDEEDERENEFLYACALARSDFSAWHNPDFSCVVAVASSRNRSTDSSAKTMHARLPF